MMCRVCGCTDDDCRQCIERTGGPCHWVEPGLCSACRRDSLLESGQREARAKVDELTARLFDEGWGFVVISIGKVVGDAAVLVAPGSAAITIAPGYIRGLRMQANLLRRMAAECERVLEQSGQPEAKQSYIEQASKIGGGHG